MYPITPRLVGVHHDSLHLILVLFLLVTASLSISASQIALGLSLLMLLARRFLVKEPIACTGLGLTTAALAGWALLNIPFSHDVGQSIVFYRRFYLFTAVWVVAAVADSDKRRLCLLIAMLFGSVSMSLIGLIRIHREIGVFWLVRFDEVSNPLTSGVLLMLVLLATSGFMLIPIDKRYRWGLALPMLVIAFTLLQTMTRSAWLGAITGLGVMFLLTRPHLLVFLAIGLLAFAFIQSELREGDLTPELVRSLDVARMFQHETGTERLEMWKVGWRMIKDRPWLGFGDHDLAKVSAEFYQDPDPETTFYGHLHSNPIMLAVIWGIPGLILATNFFAWQLILLLRRWRAYRKDPTCASRVQQAWVLGAIGAWAGFFTAGLTEYYFGDAEPMLLYLTIIGIALGTKHATRQVDGPVRIDDLGNTRVPLAE